MTRAKARGYSCHAPSWPYHEGDPANLRANIDPALGSLTFGAVTDHLKAFIDTLPEQPILIGHSVGGLFVQKLVNDGYAAAGVSINSAPPQGIFSVDPHFFGANIPHVNPLAGNKPVIMTPERFRYTFCNTMSAEASDKAFEQYVVPESHNVPRSTLTKQAKIDFRAPHIPLLFIAADKDHLTPLPLIKRKIKAYRTSESILDFAQFTNRSHFICNQSGWEEVCDFALDWVAKR